MTHRMSFGIQNDLIRYVPRGPQQTRSGVNWKSGGCGPIFQQNTMNVTYEAPTTPWDTTAGKVSLWTGVVSGGLGILAQGCQAFGLTKFPFIQRFVQSFGNQPSMMMGQPYAMGGFTSPYGMLNTGMQQSIPTGGNANYQQNLSQMYSSYKVLDNGNGTYTLTSGKGDNIKTGTYEELMKGMEGAAKTDESQGAGAKESPAKASGSETPSNQSADAKAPASAPAPANDSAKAAPAASGGGETQGVSPNRQSSGKVNVPAGWYRADTGHAEGKSLKLNQCKSATTAMTKILSFKMDYLSSSDREALTKELIRNNPSVFNKDGTVKAGANWDKLDVPSIKYIKQKYVDGATYSKGKVTYTSKKDKGQHTNASTSRGAGGQTIRGKNGYFVTFAKGTARYFDPAGNPIRPEEFKKHCPNIYKTASSYAQK